MNSPPDLNIFVNPSAGYWRRQPVALAQLESLAGEKTKVWIAREADELHELLMRQRRCAREDESSIDVIAGGDGSICRFLSFRRNLDRQSIPVLVWPTGTMNAIANDLRLKRSRTYAMIRALQAGCGWRTVSRISLDVILPDRTYSGFVFETGFASHILNEFYRTPNDRLHALLSVLKAIGSLLGAQAPIMNVSAGEAHLAVQSLFVSGITRMIFGLRPFGRSPHLPIVAEFRLTGWQQRLSCWRFATGNVGRLIDTGALVLQPLLQTQPLRITTREPINLDGEMLFVGDTRASVLADIRPGVTIDFVVGLSA